MTTNKMREGDIVPIDLRKLISRNTRKHADTIACSAYDHSAAVNVESAFKLHVCMNFENSNINIK